MRDDAFNTVRVGLNYFPFAAREPSEVEPPTFCFFRRRLRAPFLLRQPRFRKSGARRETRHPGNAPGVIRDGCDPHYNRRWRFWKTAAVPPNGHGFVRNCHASVPL